MATRSRTSRVEKHERAAAAWPIEIWQRLRVVSRRREWRDHCVVIDASGEDRQRWEAQFWRHFPDREPRLREVVMGDGGICILVRASYVRGQGLQPAYGTMSCGKAGRLCEQWRSDPARFEQQRPPAVVEAVRRFAEDDARDAARAAADWADVITHLPTPPDGYAWFLRNGGLRIPGDLWFQLYPADSYGPCCE
jgi:hypothetical protein